MASRNGPEDGVRAPSGRCNPHDLGTTRISPAPNPQCRNKPRKCKLRLNFGGLILNVRRMRLEYWVQQVAMGREVQERSRREGCGPEWRLSAPRSSAEVDDERRWNQIVRSLGWFASVNPDGGAQGCREVLRCIGVQSSIGG
jgi:hypothetical protein